jgi:hypothetical protein
MNKLCLKMAVLWKVAPCSLAEIGPRFRYLVALMMEVVGTSEILVSF